jgi:hypothetical protein
MTPEELEHRLTVIETELHQLKELNVDVKTIIARFNKYEGRWGTLILIGTAIWAVIVAFKEDFLQLFTGHK